MSARVVLFWLLALIMFSVVTVIVVWPLLRRQVRRSVMRKEVNVQVLRDQLAELDVDLQGGTLSQSQYEEARLDISRRLLGDLTADPIVPMPQASPAQLRSNKRLAIGLAVLFPVLSIVAYVYLGTPSALQGDDGAVATVSTQGGSNEGSGSPADAQERAKRTITPEKIQAMIDGLKKKVEQSPGDGQAWAMLARSYNFEGKFSEAVTAYQKAVPLNPGDGELLADYADALAMTQNKTLGPEPMKLVQAALKVDPQNAKALALSATEAFGRKDFKSAIDFWKRAIPGAQLRDPDMAQQFRVNILEANQLGGGKLIAESDIPGAPAPSPAQGADTGAAPAGQGAPAAAPAGGGKALTGHVALAPALQGKVSPGDSVFIFAKAASGPPMPLAVMRAHVQDLPMDFRLDESMAMMPGMSIASFPELIVGARISKSGNAIPASGDLQGTVTGVKAGASGLQIEISSVVP